MKPAGNQSMKLQGYGRVTELCVLNVSWTFRCHFLLNFVIELVGMSTVLLMIWLHMLLKVMEVMSGHAKIMMVMYKVISLRKVCELSSNETKLIKWHFLAKLSHVNKFFTYLSLQIIFVYMSVACNWLFVVVFRLYYGIIL